MYYLDSRASTSAFILPYEDHERVRRHVFIHFILKLNNKQFYIKFVLKKYQRISILFANVGMRLQHYYTFCLFTSSLVLLFIFIYA